MAADGLCHPDMTFRGSLGQAKTGVADFLEYVKYVRGRLESYQCVIQEAVAEADRVFAKMLFRGLHCGPFEGSSPLVPMLSGQGAAFFKFENGRILDLWVLGDMASATPTTRRGEQCPARRD